MRSVFAPGKHAEAIADSNRQTPLPHDVVTEPEISAPPRVITSPWVDSVIATLDLRQIAAQCVMPFTYSSSDSMRLDQLHALLDTVEVGGFLVSRGDTEGARIMIDSLQAWSRTPLLIAADFEYGPGMRLKGATRYPSAMALGATGDATLAYRVGRAIAEESILIGVNQNFAPVADVNNNPDNPIINTRSFGGNARLVGRLASSFARGLQAGGMLATVKHFPGHGDTDVDSHLGLPVLPFSRARIDSLELQAFRQTIRENVSGVMLAHIAIPSITGPGTPATLSAVVIDSILRGREHFNGLVVTDALNMKAVTRAVPSVKIAVMALQAGADLLLMPRDADQAVSSLVRAVGTGRIDSMRLAESARRILRAKEWVRSNAVRDSTLDSDSVRGAWNLLARETAARSITLVRNNETVLPLTPNPKRRVFVASFLRNTDAGPAEEFVSSLEERGISVIDHFIAERRIRKRVIRRTQLRARRADVIFINAFIKISSGADGLDLTEPQQALVDSLSSLEAPIVFISFGSPYVLRSCPEADAMLCTYSECPSSLEAAADAVTGATSPLGNLPVDIPGVASAGAGLTYPTAGGDLLASLNVRDPGGTRNPFSRVDRLIEEQIRKRAFPGAVLLVGMGDSILHHRAYGRFTYDSDSPFVTTETMFDLASVSKVIATTSCAMRLVQEGKLHLDSTVATYLPEFATNGKAHVTIRNLLLHNSGLPAFRTYYKFVDSAGALIDTILHEPLEYPTGTKTVYSDLGLITLGKVIEKITGMGLDEYAATAFFKPLGMSHTMYAPPDSLRSLCAPTEVDDYWRHRLVQGTVHDENAALLNGVAGHAGLFSTARDLSRFVRMLLHGGTFEGKRYLDSALIAGWTRRQSRASSRGIGWDTKSAHGSSAGKYFSANSFGHTGFTGTSVWIDPERKLYVIFLTNRVYPTRKNRLLVKFRPRLHDAVVETIERMHLQEQ